MSPSSALVAFGSLLLGAAVVSAAPTNPATSQGVYDCSGELARQSIARMQRQAQPDGVAGSNCLARQKAERVETAKTSGRVEIAGAKANPQQ